MREIEVIERAMEREAATQDNFYQAARKAAESGERVWAGTVVTEHGMCDVYVHPPQSREDQ